MLAFHPRNPCGVFHQGALRFRQHAGVSKHFELRRQQREHFPVELALGFPGNAILTWQNRKSLDPKVFGPLMALMLAGNIPGALMLSSIDGRIVKIIFGAAIILIALDMLRGQGKPRKREKMVDGAGRRRRGRAQRHVRRGRAAGGLRQPHHGDKRRVQGGTSASCFWRKTCSASRSTRRSGF